MGISKKEEIEMANEGIKGMLNFIRVETWKL